VREGGARWVADLPAGESGADRSSSD
jgi:hypothetical protein